MDRYVAHFNWGTLVNDIGTPDVAGFVNAVESVNSVAERSPGFVWRAGNEAELAKRIAWPLFDDTRVIASFSVWQTLEAFEAFVYNTVHGAFFRRRDEWFVPGQAANYVLWWVEAGQTPTISEARARVDKFLGEGPGPDVFDMTWARKAGLV